MEHIINDMFNFHHSLIQQARFNFNLSKAKKDINKKKYYLAKFTVCLVCYDRLLINHEEQQL